LKPDICKLCLKAVYTGDKMILKKITTEHGDVQSEAAVVHTDNGQVVITITSKLGDTKHIHTTTVGAEDGRDAVSSMTEADLRTSMQKHLDEKRAEAAQILTGRAKVAKVTALLQ
jgi:hypothetical protein